MKGLILGLTIFASFTAQANEIINKVIAEHEDAIEYQEELSQTLPPLARYFEVEELPSPRAHVTHDYYSCIKSQRCSLRLLEEFEEPVSIMSFNAHKYYKHAPNTDITPLIEKHLEGVASKEIVADNVNKLLRYSYFKPDMFFQTQWDGFKESRARKVSFERYFWYLKALHQRVNQGDNIEEVFDEIYDEQYSTSLKYFLENLVLELHFYNAFMEVKIDQLDKRIKEATEIEKGNIYAYPIHVLPVSNRLALKSLEETDMLKTNCSYCDWNERTNTWIITHAKKYEGQVRVTAANINKVLGKNKRIRIEPHYDDFFLLDGFVRAEFDKEQGILHVYENVTSERSGGDYGPSTIGGSRDISIWPNPQMITKELYK